MTSPSRVIILGLAHGEDVFDGVIEGGELLLARVGARRRSRTGLGGLAMLLVTWAAVIYAKVGVRRLPGATGHGLAGEDDSAARERLRMQGLSLDEIARRDARNLRLGVAALTARAIDAGDPPLVELSGGSLRAPILLEAAGDPPARLLGALKERGARID